MANTSTIVYDGLDLDCLNIVTGDTANTYLLKLNTTCQGQSSLMSSMQGDITNIEGSIASLQGDMLTINSDTVLYADPLPTLTCFTPATSSMTDVINAIDAAICALQLTSGVDDVTVGDFEAYAGEVNGDWIWTNVGAVAGIGNVTGIVGFVATIDGNKATGDGKTAERAAPSGITVIASRDNYVFHDILANALVLKDVVLGGAVPSSLRTEVIMYKFVTDGVGVVSTTDLRNNAPIDGTRIDATTIDFTAIPAATITSTMIAGLSSTINYTIDLSGTYTDRSLVDRGYVTAQISVINESPFAQTGVNYLYNLGSIGIGAVIHDTTVNLHVEGTGTGTLRIVDGNEATGKMLTSDVDGKATWQAAPPTIYTSDDVVGTTRSLVLTDTVTWVGGRTVYSGNTTSSTINSSSIIEVGQAGDLPAILAADTTYVIRGAITTSTPIAVTNSGCSIVGLDRNRDKLIWNGLTGTTMLTVADVDFDLENLCLSSNNTGSILISANNYSAGTYNDGRSKVFTINNCQFRNCFDIASFDGFDLVDISNTLFWYCEAPNHGVKFTNTSKIEISSCELIRWFRESTIPAPANYATCPMIELVNGTSNFGAVNINGCVVHPQQTQDGIKIDTASATGFGTISSNAFVTVGLTTGVVFSPVLGGLSLPDYSQAATYNYDVFANQGVLNSVSGAVMTISGNTTNTALSSGTPAVMNAGGLAVDRSSVRYTVSTGGRCTYNGTKQAYVSVHGSLAYQKKGGGTDPYVFYLYKNGVLLADSEVDILSGGATADGIAALTYGTLMSQNDYIEVYIENPGSNDDMLVKSLQLVIRE